MTQQKQKIDGLTRVNLYIKETMINATSSSSICRYCGRSRHRENICYHKHGSPLRTNNKGVKGAYSHKGRIYIHYGKMVIPLNFTIEFYKFYHVVKGFT